MTNKKIWVKIKRHRERTDVFYGRRKNNDRDHIVLIEDEIVYNRPMSRGQTARIEGGELRLYQIGKYTLLRRLQQI